MFRVKKQIWVNFVYQDLINPGVSNSRALICQLFL